MTTSPVRATPLAGLAGRLTARDRWLLAMLGEHTVLTTAQLHRLGWAASLRAVQARARTLHQLGVVDRFRPLRPRGEGSAPLHLLLGPYGAQVLAAAAGASVAEIGYRGRPRAATIAHRITLAHDVATTDLVCAIAATPELRLVRWWSATRCGRNFGAYVHPDAYLTLTLTTPPDALLGTAGGAGGWWEMFVEYDTGTENLGRLTAKLDAFHSLAHTTGAPTPVGFWFARPGREPGARRALAEALRALPHPELVPILTATPTPDGPRDPAPAAGPGGRVWLPLRAHHTHPGRRTLAELAAGHPPTVRPGRVTRLPDTSVLPAPPPHPPALDATPGRPA